MMKQYCAKGATTSQNDYQRKTLEAETVSPASIPHFIAILR